MAAVRVLYFGVARDVTGREHEEFDADDIHALRKQLIERYPGMQAVYYRLALNKKLVEQENALKDNDIVAILPPFSGG